MSFLLDTNILSAHLRRPSGLAHYFFQIDMARWVIDRATEGFVGDAQANALVKRTCREPYTVPEIA